MKLRYAFAALAVAAVSLPSLASAEITVIKKVYRDGPRAEMRHHDRGMHRGWDRHHRHHADRVVVIKKRRY
ncbi:hypothetical protein [Rhodopseudomonas telluris]|uniref:Uncharacterized protein n=1 Tax=Rhodopseudomonas telluris TaxID=644215 RepID=A0ABV6EQA8_9BRAD